MLHFLRIYVISDFISITLVQYYNSRLKCLFIIATCIFVDYVSTDRVGCLLEVKFKTQVLQD